VSRLRAGALLLLLAPVVPAAAAPAVSATVDRSAVPMGETLVLSVTVSGADQATAPSLGNLGGFDIVSTGESRAFTMGSGGMASQIVFEYVLRPKSPGQHTIPAVSVQVGGQVLRTQAVTVQVSPAAGSGASGAPPTLPAPAVPPGGVSPPAGEEVFIRCAVDKQRAYVGEPLLLTFYLYYSVRLGAVDYEPAETEGFRTQALPPPATRYETLNGRQYVVKQELKLLFATGPGKHTITPARLRYTTGYWDPVPREVATEPLQVEVSRLPETGRPAGFGGAVGEVAVEAHADRDTLRMGEAATLTVAVRGWGNLDTLEPPTLTLPEGLRQYQSSEHREVAPEAAGVGYRLAGEALFDHVIIPTALGDLTVPPVELSYFDPQAEAYRTARSRPIVLHVLPGEGETPGAVPGSGAAVKPLPDRLRGAHPGRLLSAPVLVSQALALAWLLGTLLVQRRRAALLADPKLARARSAARRATRLAALAGRLPPPEGAAAIASAVAGYVADRLDVPVATVSAGSVEALLVEYHVPPEASTRLAAVLAACDAARFGPVAEVDPRELAQQAAEAVRSAERRIGGRR